MNRAFAEEHWEFIERLLVLSGVPVTKLIHYLYVEAMLHGAKHEKDYIESLKKNPAAGSK